MIRSICSPPVADAAWCFQAHGTATRAELSAIRLLPARTRCDEQRLRQLRRAVWKCSLTCRKTGQDGSACEDGPRDACGNVWTRTGLGSQRRPCALRRPCIYHTRSRHHSSFKNTSSIIPGPATSASWPSAIPLRSQSSPAAQRYLPTSIPGEGPATPSTPLSWALLSPPSPTLACPS